MKPSDESSLARGGRTRVSSALRRGLLLVLAFVLAAAATTLQSQVEELADTTLRLLAYFGSTLIVLAVSYFVGRHSGKEMAQEIVRPHARNSVRRLISVYRSLGRMGSTIAASKPLRGEAAVLVATIKAHVWEQLNNADAALRGWSDIVPEELEKLVREERVGLELMEREWSEPGSAGYDVEDTR